MKRQRRLLEQPELPSTFSDTSVEDHESEECDTRLATSTMVEAVDEVNEAAARVLHLSTPVVISSISYAISRSHTSKGDSNVEDNLSIQG